MPVPSPAFPPGCVWLTAAGRNVRANLTLDKGVVAFIDGEARRRRMTRTAFVEWMARRIAQEGG